MTTSNNLSSLADDSRPNAGRIYDYFLGGDHNFEVDRMAAQQLLQESPYVPKMLRLLRWFLGEATRRLIKEGYTQFLDFASALPVQDHIHQIAPEGAKVIYSDIDPVTVAYAQDIIGENPNVRYVQCNAANPENILNSGITGEMFNTDKKLAIGLSGITYFLTDDELVKALKILYDWAPKGTRLFLSESDHISSEATQGADQIFARMGSAFHWRSKKKFKTMIGKWQVTEPGYLYLEEWLELSDMVSKEEIESMGIRFYGAIFQK